MDDRLKVLVVEDDEDDFVLTCGLLKEVEGLHFEVEWAPTFEAGAEQVRQMRHDLYLFDYRLGADSGLDLLSLAGSVGCAVPAILLTGQKTDGIDIEALRAGAADYLAKGQFDSQLLGRSIRYSIERKRAEQALRASEERYRDLLENANDMVFTHDWHGRLTSVNAATEQVTGYSRTELVGMNLSNLLTPESISKFEDMKLRKMSRERTGAYEIAIRTKRGKILVIEVNDRVIGNGRGNGLEPLEFQAIGRDITERRSAEQKLREYALEIEKRK